MAYLVIDDFRLGMDRRKKRVSGKPGMLWTGKNGHITRGGDFERRKKFVSKYTLPTAATKGLATVGGQLYVFGAGATPGGMPAGVNYQRLQHPSSGTAVISKIKSVTSFSGKLYVVAEFDDGNTYHYYDGTRVTAWDTIASAVSSNNAVATALAAKIDADSRYAASAASNVVTITAQTAGVPYTISASTVNGGSTNDQNITLNETQANITGAAEVLSTATLTITGGTSNPGVNKLSSVTIDGVEVLGSAVDWTTSNSATATAIAAQITSYSSSPEYTAVAAGNVVTISAAAGTGSGPNGFVVADTPAGDLTLTSSGVMAGGSPAASSQAQITEATVSGTFESADIFTITLDGTDFVVSGGAAGTGTFALTFQQKVYSVTNSLLYFSALSSATAWGSGIGNGFINMSNQNEGNETLTAIEEYQGKLAIFSRNGIRIWRTDVDPELNTFEQTIQNTGTNSPRSVMPYGNIDVFYLDDSGIRSIRARDSSNAPAVNDVGVAIDSFVQEFVNSAGVSESDVQNAVSEIEPTDGRYLLAIQQRIFVFSYFPGSKINAWSYYDLSDELGEGDVIEELLKLNRQLFLRSGDTVYLYGGDAGTTYPSADEIECEAALPFLGVNSIATFKGLQGLDIMGENVWDIFLLTDPNDEDVEIPAGKTTGTTVSQPRNVIQAVKSVFAPRLVCNTAGYASISSLVIHYKAEEAG